MGFLLAFCVIDELAVSVSTARYESSLRGLIPAMESTAFALGVVAATCGFGGAAIGYTEPEDLWTSLARVM